MRIPNRAAVLVTDGRKRLLFRNEGDAEYPKLEALLKEEDVNPADHVQKSDAPGHMSSAAGDRRSAYDEGDFHRQEEADFAGETVRMLNERALQGRFEQLIIVADPRTLGALRGHYHRTLEQRLIGEVAKDLVKHPVADIERIIGDS